MANTVDPDKNHIVGVDLAGGYPSGDSWQTVAEVLTYENAFKKAKELGLGVTVHAGECKGPDSVVWAIEKCLADRIGHGYRLFEDDKLVEKYFSNRDSKWHYEFCPRSSILTCAQKEDQHCLKNVRPGNRNMSLSTDDEGVQLNALGVEYEFACDKYGWGREDFINSNINALKAAFSKEVDEAYISKFLTCYQK